MKWFFFCLLCLCTSVQRFEQIHVGPVCVWISPCSSVCMCVYSCEWIMTGCGSTEGIDNSRAGGPRGEQVDTLQSWPCTLTLLSASLSARLSSTIPAQEPPPHHPYTPRSLHHDITARPFFFPRVFFLLLSLVPKFISPSYPVISSLVLLLLSLSW